MAASPLGIDERLSTKGLKLVLHVARDMYYKYSIPDADLEDFIGWGYEGLCEASKRWEPSISSFTVYAWYWIRYKIQTGIDSWCGTRRPSRNGQSRTSIAHLTTSITTGLNEDTSPDSTPIEENHESRELKRHLHSLPNSLCIPIIYKYYYDLTDKEVCIALHITHKELIEALETAIKTLRDMYGHPQGTNEDESSPQ